MGRERLTHEMVREYSRMTTYRVQFWNEESGEWLNCSVPMFDYDDALGVMRLHAENDDRMPHRLVATQTDVVAMSFKESEVVR